MVEKGGKVVAVLVSPEQYAATEQRGEVATMEAGMTAIQSQPRRLTEQETKQGLEALDQARVFREAVRARRGGTLCSDSAALIREEREERSSRV